MSKRLLLALLLPLVASCGLKPVGGAVVRSAAPLAARELDPTLVKDVQAGFRLIFSTYDAAPRDNKLSFAEFGHVVDSDWFKAHDTNHDGFILFDEWLTPGELATQVAAIAAQGQALVKAADKDHDGLLSREEYGAYQGLEIDPTPWLAAKADAAIKLHDFDAFAHANQLDAVQAGLMVGDLLAKGYYLDDGSDGRRVKFGLLPSSRGAIAPPR